MANVEIMAETSEAFQQYNTLMAEMANVEINPEADR
jgi:hypothetical protein